MAEKWKLSEGVGGGSLCLENGNKWELVLNEGVLNYI
jgi:hypothetical protein